MYSQKSRHKDDFACCRGSSGGLPKDCASYSWHRFPCSGNSICLNSSAATGTTSRSLGCNGYSHFRHVGAHEFSNSLGSGMSKALPVFHAFIACDTVLLRQEWHEDCIHSLEEFPSHHRCRPTASSYTYQSNKWSMHGTSRSMTE